MVPAMVVIPIALQGLAMAVDELWFHRRRGLPRWERLGHPLDTLTVALCYGWLVALPPSQPDALGIYVGFCAFSSLKMKSCTRDFATRSRPGCMPCCSCCTRSCFSRWR